VTPTTEALKWGAIACCTAAQGLAAIVVATDRDGALRRGWARYCGWLEDKMYRTFVFRHGYPIALGQLFGLVAVAAAAVAVPVAPPIAAALAVAVAGGPAFVLSRRLRRRVAQIDGQVEGLLVVMANALKSRPSVGDALASVLPVTRNPLRQELELAVKQMRLGSTVEQALLHLSGRVGSKPLDTALSAVLIGRQVGGNLPSILETSAEAMREMARLEGVVRTKTAEGKAQLWVLALFPLVLMVGFSAVSRGYFDPLTESATGYVVTVVAFALWAAAIGVARRILTVDI
jgi:tight adherence protein B